ncbi:UNVERIFIED_ORG: hypothetical protein LHK14_11610 [Roseateles sp. XES5]|nr:hypothetical protein [Roseateles sp. XES5]
MASSGSVIDWLLDSDPAIRWQVMRDLLDAPETEWQAERARVEAEGWGAKLLSHQDEDGQWAGGAFLPADYSEEKWRAQGQAWTATCFSLQQLHEFGLDPASQRARNTIDLIGRHCRWDHDGQPFWDGEVEECVNARTVTAGVYFGVDVSRIVARLLGERQADGGWNCERCNGSHRSSFHTTINVLEALLAYERAEGATPEIRAARRAGEEYLLERCLFRGLARGAVVDERYLAFLYPYRWRYDVLRALDHFRAAGGAPDPRLAEAIAHLRSKQGPDGTWRLDWSLKGPVWFEMETAGEPSRWITFRALRVLRWWNENAGR